jgi:Ca2+-binding RTX toxin-like protein
MNDAMEGRGGNDALRAGEGNDVLRGGEGDDTLYGEGGNDFLYGDAGLDNIYGGLGVDIFVFTKDSAFLNIDSLLDFNKGQGDKINVADLLQGYDPLTEAITDFVRITTVGSSSMLEIDSDGGANSFVQIATVNGGGLTDEQALVTSGNLVVV